MLLECQDVFRHLVSALSLQNETQTFLLEIQTELFPCTEEPGGLHVVHGGC